MKCHYLSMCQLLACGIDISKKLIKEGVDFRIYFHHGLFNPAMLNLFHTLRPRQNGHHFADVSVGKKCRTCQTFPTVKPKYLARDLTNLNRIYKAHQTNEWWTMKVFRSHWDDIFKCIFMNENHRISNKISLKYVLLGLTDNISGLVQWKPCLLMT